MSPDAVLGTIRRAEYAEYVGLFFIQGAALGMWFVPLSTVLGAHGYEAIRPYAFATSAIAAFISPLFFGAMADRHMSPVQVMRRLAVATALAMALATTGIQLGWPPGVVLGLIQFHALCSSPAWSIASTIVFARLRDSRREFGPIRAMATLGWMAGCWLVSLLGADHSTMAGYTGSVTWLAVAGLTYLLPVVTPMGSGGRVTLRQRFGLDALALLKNRDHRVVFLIAALFNIPLAAFYPYAPVHLKALGLQHTSAWMSLGQVTEIVAMALLAGLLTRWRLKWVFAFGLGFGVLRFALSALDSKLWILAGISLHGCSYALVFITAQIYLDERVDSAWRARAQALLYLMTSGAGNLAGYLGTGCWFATNTRNGSTHWAEFWGGLSITVLVILAYFMVAYHGRGFRSPNPKSAQPGPA